MKKRYKLLLLLLISFSFAMAQDVENEFQYRLNGTVVYDISDDFSVQFSPEIRFEDIFSPDKYLLETELQYNLFEFLSFEGGYRFVVNPRNKKDTEILHRFALGISLEKEINRFKGKLNIRYTNDADDLNYDYNFFRYSAGLKYNIPKCKITPYIAVKVYHQLNDNVLYKMRYTGGLNYKINKHHSVSLNYKLDYYMREYLNKHIIGIGYKYKF